MFFFLEHPALGYFKNWWYLACHATTTTKYAVVCGFSRKMHRSPLPTPPPWFDGWTNHRFNFSETKCKRAKACQFKIPFLGRNYRHPLQITLSVCLAAVCLMKKKKVADRLGSPFSLNFICTHVGKKEKAKIEFIHFIINLFSWFKKKSFEYLFLEWINIK